MRARVYIYSALALVLGALGSVVVISSRYSPVHAAETKAAPSQPVPVEQTNCVRCHLTAGRELTEAVHTFAHSVHDRVANISCHDCHGGNLKDDAKAHTSEGFIGTKLSAHLEKCQSCHEDQYKSLSSGPHAWNHQKKLNIRYPLCVDCHGNHDVGNPPAEFSLTLVCSECHRTYKQKEPLYASLTDAQDKMWAAILDWQKKHPESETRVPEPLEKTLGEIRGTTSDLIHGSKTLTDDEVKGLVNKIDAFVTEIKAKSTASTDKATK